LQLEQLFDFVLISKLGIIDLHTIYEYDSYNETLC